jgi:hypothetical protein
MRPQCGRSADCFVMPKPDVACPAPGGWVAVGLARGVALSCSHHAAAKGAARSTLETLLHCAYRLGAMPTNTARSPMIQTAAAALALFAMLFTGLVPSGWMPQARAGSVELVICRGAGAISQIVELDGHAGSAPAEHPGKASAPCLFAGLGQAGPMPADVASLAIALSPTARPAPPTVPSTARQPAHRRLPPSQGPPLSV